ncbi:preprotein translocase subunit Tim44 [Meridianimarinicoccus roseus]|jgi:predicted lipid-binding transport protein (Tim44 family)|uniref:Preprotein translocase subunit Tim44 n=1 Tax=Meridianimarinicoccus roseus TaxID=2072018 RepID=A0A2V2LHB1_9RHOB|nr:Tim44/TimA family putative adaptor protein [Meridianimarinicoccus roseus]PWR02894.1 preprotein translocase subunit Tim44 [Meridianimarinicoccus roseus]
MSSAVIQLLVLAGVAIFLILRLKSVLGTREGFEKPAVPQSAKTDPRGDNRPEFEVIEGGPDHDIIDNVPAESPAASALAAMKRADPDFNVTGFLQGARGAYEMILMGFKKGDLSDVEGFIAPDVLDSFGEAVAERERQGLSIDATFVGIRELKLLQAVFDEDTREAELTVRFVGEMTSVVRNPAGEIVEGNPQDIVRQRDTWTFARDMNADDPNWQLVATGD